MQGLLKKFLSSYTFVGKWTPSLVAVFWNQVGGIHAANRHA
jgi:hypothetical protein